MANCGACDLGVPHQCLYRGGGGITYTTTMSSTSLTWLEHCQSWTDALSFASKVEKQGKPRIRGMRWRGRWIWVVEYKPRLYLVNAS